MARRESCANARGLAELTLDPEALDQSRREFYLPDQAWILEQSRRERRVLSVRELTCQEITNPLGILVDVDHAVRPPVLVDKPHYPSRAITIESVGRNP